MSEKKIVNHYLYEEKEPYNKSVTVKGKKLRCYSKDKLAKMFPRGGCFFVGKIFNGNESANAGTLKVENDILPICAVESNREKNLVDVGYIQVGENQFIAVMKKAGAAVWWWIGGVLLAVAVAITSTVLMVSNIRKTPVDPEKEDPYIKPIETEILTVSGTVTHATEKAENAELMLYQGQTEIARTTTDKNGKYLFNKVSNGVYTLKVSYGNASEVCAVIIDHQSVIQNFNLTDSNLTVNINIADKQTPAVAVNGLSEAAKQQIVDGKHVDVTLVATKLEAENVPATDKALITAKSGETVLTYFDFSIYREIFSLSGVRESKNDILEIEQPLEIIIPYDSSRDVGTYVFRTHEGVAVKFTELSARPYENYQDATCYITKDYVFIYTKYFSTYAIGSASAGKVTKGSDTVTYSDKAYVNLTDKKIEMLYKHDADSTNSVRIEMYLIGENANLLISTSGIIPAGNQLDTMILLDNVSGMPSVGTYEGLMKIIYLGESGNTATNVDIPLSVAITR